MVVRVAVDDAAPQAGERGHDLRLVAVERPLDERPARGVGHVVERAADPRGAGEVPREVAVGARVLEVARGPRPSRRGGGRGARAAPASAGGPRPASCPAARSSIADEAGRAVRPRGDGHGLAGARGDDAGQGQVRARAPRGAAGPRTAARRAPARARGAWPSARRAARPARSGGSCRRTRPGAPAPRPRGRRGAGRARPRPPRSGGGRGGPRAARAGLCYTFGCLSRRMTRRCRSTGRPMGGGADVRAHRRHGMPVRAEGGLYANDRRHRQVVQRVEGFRVPVA